MNRIKIKYGERVFSSLTELSFELGISIQSIGKSLKNGHLVKGKEIERINGSNT